MRQGPNNRRSRGRGPRRPHPNQNPRQQTFDSSGPDIRIRGNAYQVLEKYLAMARDATSAGDRIAAENYYQHAEHYYRVISAAGGAHNGQNGRQNLNGPGQDNQFGEPMGDGTPRPGDNGQRSADNGEGDHDDDGGDAPAEVA